MTQDKSNKLTFVLKRILFFGFMTIAGILLILFVLYLTAKSNYYFENASIINAPLHKRIAASFKNGDGKRIDKIVKKDRTFPVTGSYIINGAGTVIQYHEYYDPFWRMIDDESAESITIFLPQGLKDNVTIQDFDTNNIIIFYAGGPPGFFNACTGYPRNGEVKIKKISFGRIRVQLKLDMKLWSTRRHKWCKEREVVKSFKVHKHLLGDYIKSKQVETEL